MINARSAQINDALMPSRADLMTLSDDGFRLRCTRAIKRTKRRWTVCAMPRSCS